MDVSFGLQKTLPEQYKSGKIYFIEGEGAIYVATSETNIIKYSSYQELEKLKEISTNKQDVIEDLETIRNDAAVGATMAQKISIIENKDIDAIFDSNN